MFANPIRIEIDGFGVTLRPLRKNEMEHIAELFASMEVLRYTNMVYAPTLQSEEEWWEKASKEPTTAIWGIVPDGEDAAIGVTGLHQINAINHSCTSGIIIADRNWWHKGVAYRAHLARTWYAVNTLNRYTIQSQVRAENAYSLKALLKVGYRISGRLDCNCFHDGVFCDTRVLSWVNPCRVDVLYPNGVPEELHPSLDKAKQALELAQTVIKFL